MDLDRDAFRAAVRDSEMSLREIATVSGLSYSALKKYSSGQRRYPTRQTYRKLVVALGLPRGSLIIEPHPRVAHESHTGGE